LAACLTPAARGDGWSVWPFNKEDKPGKPDKVVALWSDTVLTQTGRAPLRGFGGRLMFYEGKKEEPIKVEGTLVIYAFDETDRDANNTRPDRKYAFTPEQLPAHYSKSKVGHSYSVWLPWDEIGGTQKEITLIVRFQPKEGAVAIGEPCRQLLPGRIAPTQPKALAVPGNPQGPSLGTFPGQGNDGVQRASYQAPTPDGAGLLTAEWQQRRMSTATIAVPSGSALRSALSAPQMSPATRGYYQPGPGASPMQNNASQSIPPQGYSPPATPSSVTPGLQLRTGFTPGRQWPIGEPMARINRDRTPPMQRPAEPSAGTPPTAQVPANMAPVAPQGVQQLPSY
jgi:hypothetical protein